MVGGISGSEFSKMWINNVFNELDSNADGQVSKSEFQEAFSKILTEKMFAKGGVLPDIDKDELFSKIDKDADGKISKEEFCQFIEDRKKAPPPSMPYGFNLLDLLISFDSSDLFSEIDKDGDGVISQDEFVKYIEKQKEAFQANMQSMYADINVDNETITISNTDNAANTNGTGTIV
jgi:Ca2+-binding EF-hand superfamily protein